MKNKYFLILAILVLPHYIIAQDNDANEKINESFFGKSPATIVEELAVRANLVLELNNIELSKNLKVYSFRDITIREAIERIVSDNNLHYVILYNRLIIDDEPIVLNDYKKVDKTNFNLSGQIIDASNREALAYATVGIPATGQGAITNADGFFTLLNVPTDTLVLDIQYVGYQKFSVPIKTIIDQNPLVIELEESSQVLDEIIVKGSNLDDEMISAADKISQISVSPEALSKLPSMGEKDIFRGIQLLPGISGTNEASSGLFVRGGTPDQNLIQLDGFTVYHVDHFYGFFSAFNPNAIKNVQLYKGGFESKYGGRLSSVMELTGKTGNQNKFSGGAGIGAISANGYLEIPFGDKLNLFVAGRRSYTDVIKSGIYNDVFDLYNSNSSQTQPQNPSLQGAGGRRNTQQEETEPAFFFYDANAKLSFRPTLKDAISLSFYSGKDDLDNSDFITRSGTDGGGNTLSTEVATTDLLQWGNVGTSLRWARQWNDRFYSNAIVSYSNYFSDRDLTNSRTTIRSDTTINAINSGVELNDLLDYSMSINNEYLLSNNHTIEFGGQAIYNDVAYSFVRNDTLTVNETQNSGLQVAGYLQDTWSVNNKLTITGGVRSTYFDITDKLYHEPRLSASYQLTPKIKLKAAWGHYYQFVNRIVREDVSQGSRDFWLLADDEQSPVSFSRHLIAGLSYETNNWLFDIEVYDKSLDGIVEFSDRQSALTLSDLENANFFFEGDGVARGMELLIQKKIGRYKGWVSYTLGEVVHDIPGISDEPFYALHDTRHEVNVVNTYEVGRWELGATWVYGTGKPYTAPSGEYELTTIDGETYNYINVGGKNALRLPDYHRLDLSANYNFKLGDGAKGQLGITFFNLYNRENTWFKRYEISEEVIETDVNLIGFTPNLNFSIKF